MERLRDAIVQGTLADIVNEMVQLFPDTAEEQGEKFSAK